MINDVFPEADFFVAMNNRLLFKDGRYRGGVMGIGRKVMGEGRTHGNVGESRTHENVFKETKRYGNLDFSWMELKKGRRKIIHNPKSKNKNQYIRKLKEMKSQIKQ